MVSNGAAIAENPMIIAPKKLSYLLTYLLTPPPASDATDFTTLSWVGHVKGWKEPRIFFRKSF